VGRRSDGDSGDIHSNAAIVRGSPPVLVSFLHWHRLLSTGDCNVLAFLVPWVLRFFWYPEDVKRDLAHPVRGNFFPTMPISFILAGTGTNKLGPLLFGPTVSCYLGVVFFFLGAIGIFTFGFLLTRAQFLNRNVAFEHANFAWFIPPVSHLIIPVLGACSMDVHWAETPLAPVLFITSMVALSVGFFNFLFVGAAVWHRYIYAAIPPGQLAPTLMVAIAPTAIIVVFLMKFAQALEAAHGTLYGVGFAATFPIIKLAAAEQNEPSPLQYMCLPAMRHGTRTLY